MFGISARHLRSARHRRRALRKARTRGVWHLRSHLRSAPPVGPGPERTDARAEMNAKWHSTSPNDLSPGRGSRRAKRLTWKRPFRDVERRLAYPRPRSTFRIRGGPSNVHVRPDPPPGREIVWGRGVQSHVHFARASTATWGKPGVTSGSAVNPPERSELTQAVRDGPGARDPRASRPPSGSSVDSVLVPRRWPSARVRGNPLQVPAHPQTLASLLASAGSPARDRFRTAPHPRMPRQSSGPSRLGCCRRIPCPLPSGVSPWQLALSASRPVPPDRGAPGPSPAPASCAPRRRAAPRRPSGRSPPGR